MENYGVKYNIQVIADPAIEAIAKFARATDNLNIASTKFKNLQTAAESLNKTLNKFKTQKTPVVQINTKPARDNINKLIGRIDQLKVKLNQLGLTSVAAARSWAATPPLTAAMNGVMPTTPVIAPAKASKQPKTPKQPKAPRQTVVRRPVSQSALSYRALGPSMIDSGGIGAVSLLKGMGIAYGISAIGSLASNVVKDATEYDNLMQSTRNILEAHDKRGNFDGRFSEMEKIVRQVGVETKFTAPQVADASKFLAMAGFDLDAINQSIRPIADIALVGDTDLGETADVVTNIMTGYNIAPGKVRKAADVMTMTFTKSNTTLMELAEAYKYAASLLSAGGISFEESTAGLGVLGDAGIKGSQAGTTMRTIMANIVNPTKKQAAEWKRVGVKRLDENGNARNLVDIFSDLADKNLNVSSFYKMFHKTAAMGAVALANHVDKWNEVVELNFMSEGMVGDLAEKKKNTIQGLWAQLTSMFTEGGMQAFEVIQPEIKELLNRGVAFLHSDEAIDGIKKTSLALFDLVKSIIKITGVFYNFWEKYQGVIMFWLKLQLVLSAVLTPLRAMKGLMNFGKYAFASVASIGAMTRQVGVFTGAMKQATLAKGALNQAMANGNVIYQQAASTGMIAQAHGIANWLPIGGKKYTKTAADVAAKRTLRGAGITRSFTSDEVAARYNQIYASQLQRNRQANWANFRMQGAQMMTGAGTMVGGMAGSYIGSQLTDGSMWGSVLGGVVGMGAGLLGPWGLLVGAAAAFGGYIIDANNAAEKQLQKAQKLSDELRVQNNLLVGKGISSLVENLNAVFLGEQQITNEVERRMGIRRQENETTGKTGTNISLKESAAKQVIQPFEDMAWWTKFFTNYEDTLLNTLVNNNNTAATPNLFVYDREQGGYVLDPRALDSANTTLWKGGNRWYRWNMGNYYPGKDSYSLHLEADQAVMAAAMRRAGIEQSVSLLNGYFDEIQQALASGKTGDLISVFNRYDQETAFPDGGKDELKRSYKDFDNLTQEQKNNNPYFRQGIFDATSKYLGKNSALRLAAEQYIKEKDAGTLSEETILDTLRALNPQINDFIAAYMKGNIQDALKAIGYENGTFHDINDPTKTPQLDAAKVARDMLADVNKFISALGGYAVGQAKGFMNNLHGAMNLTTGVVGAWDGKGVLEDNLPLSADINGVSYKKDKDGNYYPQGVSVLPPLSPLQFQEAYKNSMGGLLDANGIDVSNTPTHTHTGADQSNYKSHYGNGSAAPKQIIIKIDKMLGIEKIDMANKDKAEVVSIVEEYVTQGLINALSNATAAINANPTT